jgi:hypothetical protein
MRITRFLPLIDIAKINFRHLTELQEQVELKIITSKFIDERETYAEVLKMLDRIEEIKLYKENSNKIDYP